MKGCVRFIHGAIWGAAIGTTVTILIAPTSGRKLRQAILDHFDYVITEGKRAAEAKRLELEREFAEMSQVHYGDREK